MGHQITLPDLIDKHRQRVQRIRRGLLQFIEYYGHFTIGVRFDSTILDLCRRRQSIRCPIVSANGIDGGTHSLRHMIGSLENSPALIGGWPIWLLTHFRDGFTLVTP